MLGKENMSNFRAHALGVSMSLVVMLFIIYFEIMGLREGVSALGWKFGVFSATAGVFFVAINGLASAFEKMVEKHLKRYDVNYIESKKS